MSLLDTTEKLRRDRALIETLIEDPVKLGPDFQAVRRLDDDAVVGWKATGSGQAGTELDNTLALLQSAQAIGLVERLDWAFRCLAFDVFSASAHKDVELYLTPEPETYGSPCPPRLFSSFSRGRRELKVAAEVPLHAFTEDSRALDTAVHDFRSWGWRVVADDVADLVESDPSLLARLDAVRPDVVKLDLAKRGRSTLATAPGVKELLAWCQANGATVMALGVDTPDRRTIAKALGATTGRGTALGAPGPLPAQ